MSQTPQQPKPNTGATGRAGAPAAADADIDLYGPLPPDDVVADSEPRRRWKPNAELLRALADARKDLKPGESSLFWDWTATRDTAPEAEEMRPSGEGEVFVCDKEAAAAYVAPVSVAPAAPPRPSTKSRIRVREDVDPRRQPTVKTARGDGPVSGLPPAFRDAIDSCPPSERCLPPPSCPAPPGVEIEGPPSAPPEPRIIERPRFVPSDPPPPFATRAADRRRRVLAALLLGCVAGAIVFFWLRLPREPASTAPARPPPCTTTMVESPPPAPVLTDRSPDGAGTSAPTADASATPAPPDRSAPRPPAAPSQEAASPPRSTPAPEPHRAHEAAPAPGKTGFLIRKKKGPN